MRLLFAVLLTIAAMQRAPASFERVGEGPRISALGGAGVALSADPWVFQLNPGCAPPGEGVTLSLAHAPSPFGLRELSRSACICVFDLPCGAIAASGAKLGFDLYQELTFRLAFGSAIVTGFRLGGALTCYRLAIQGYGIAATLGVDVGLLWVPSHEIQIGFCGTNVNAPVIGRSRERLPQTISIGAAYSPGQGVLVLCDLVKDIRFPTELRFGIEYSPLKPISLRAGAGRDPSTYGGGVGIHLGLLTLDYAIVRHEALGLTHALGVTVRLGDL